MATIETPAGSAIPDEVAALEAGLDALDAPARPARRRKHPANFIGPVVAAGLLVGGWLLAVRLSGKPTYLLPTPGDVWRSLLTQWHNGAAAAAVAHSLRRGAIGFLTSLAIGTGLGLFLAEFPLIRRSVNPLISGLASLPSVAWVPAAIIWFGLTDRAVYAVVLLGAVPSITNGLLSGIDQVPPLYRRAGRSMGAGRIALLRHVVVPAALPGYLAGLRQGWAFAWRALMGAELIAYSPALGPGLGQLLDIGREVSDMALVLAAVVLILLVGVAVELAVFGPLERRILADRGLLRSGR